MLHTKQQYNTTHRTFLQNIVAKVENSRNLMPEHDVTSTDPARSSGWIFKKKDVISKDPSRSSGLI